MKRSYSKGPGSDNPYIQDPESQRQKVGNLSDNPYIPDPQPQPQRPEVVNRHQKPLSHRLGITSFPRWPLATYSNRKSTFSGFKQATSATKKLIKQYLEKIGVKTDLSPEALEALDPYTRALVEAFKTGVYDQWKTALKSGEAGGICELSPECSRLTLFNQQTNDGYYIYCAYEMWYGQVQIWLFDLDGTIDLKTRATIDPKCRPLPVNTESPAAAAAYRYVTNNNAHMETGEENPKGLIIHHGCVHPPGNPNLKPFMSGEIQIHRKVIDISNRSGHFLPEWELEKARRISQYIRLFKPKDEGFIIRFFNEVGGIAADYGAAIKESEPTETTRIKGKRIKYKEWDDL